MSVADTSGGASTPTSGALPPGFDVVKNTHSNDLGFGIRDSGFGFRVSGFGFRVSGFGIGCRHSNELPTTTRSA